MEDQKNVYEPKDNSTNHNYHEETAAEVAVPYDVGNTDVNRTEEVGGKGLGYTALAFAILSLFFAPLLWGTVGIVLGFMAVRKGRVSLGSWAIGISAFSMIVRLFFVPFF
ncbi:DUF4190 domain-containing protein [Bacillus sp. JJ722]|uniref:DUF4190 domain-containing protein n=1 Tax=Bacillus sp. JJ722 TaxID=3122973 RepID=UPI002FFE001A